MTLKREWIANQPTNVLEEAIKSNELDNQQMQEEVKRRWADSMPVDHPASGRLRGLGPTEYVRETTTGPVIEDRRKENINPIPSLKHTCQTDTGQYTKCLGCEEEKAYDQIDTKRPPDAEVTSDDRHVFASGAMSSGQKPRYFQTMPQYCFARFANQRAYGDAKYGENNWMKGATDKEFILDRINHGIEHLYTIARRITEGGVDDIYKMGEDDAAAVMCCGMFVMWYERAQAMARLAPLQDKEWSVTPGKGAEKRSPMREAGMLAEDKSTDGPSRR